MVARGKKEKKGKGASFGYMMPNALFWTDVSMDLQLQLFLLK